MQNSRIENVRPFHPTAKRIATYFFVLVYKIEIYIFCCVKGTDCRITDKQTHNTSGNLSTTHR